MIQRKKPLRAQNTLEARLWVWLKPLGFRRKAPFKSFTLDFAQHDAGLVVLLEEGEPGRLLSKRGTGAIVRDRLLSEAGYVILRLWRREAERDLHSAVHRVKAVLEDLNE